MPEPEDKPTSTETTDKNVRLRATKAWFKLAFDDPAAAGLTIHPDGWLEMAEIRNVAKERGLILPFILAPIFMRVRGSGEKPGRFALKDGQQFVRVRRGGESVLGMERGTPPAVLWAIAPPGESESTGLSGGHKARVNLSVSLGGLPGLVTDEVPTELRWDEAGCLRLLMGSEAVEGAGIFPLGHQVMRVDAARMAADGLPFYVRPPTGWTVELVPAKYLARPVWSDYPVHPGPVAE